MSDVVSRTAARQVRQVFNTFLQAISNCPEDQFQVDAGDRHASIGDIAMHAAGSVEDTFGDEAFQVKWGTPVLSKPQCIAYIESCRDDLLLPCVESEDLTAEDPQPQYFVSKLDRVMKILRHVAQHTGEINLLLRQRGLPMGKFIGK